MGTHKQPASAPTCPTDTCHRAMEFPRAIGERTSSLSRCHGQEILRPTAKTEGHRPVWRGPDQFCRAFGPAPKVHTPYIATSCPRSPLRLCRVSMTSEESIAPNSTGKCRPQPLSLDQPLGCQVTGTSLNSTARSSRFTGRETLCRVLPFRSLGL